MTSASSLFFSSKNYCFSLSVIFFKATRRFCYSLSRYLRVFRSIVIACSSFSSAPTRKEVWRLDSDISPSLSSALLLIRNTKSLSLEIYWLRAAIVLFLRLSYSCRTDFSSYLLRRESVVSSSSCWVVWRSLFIVFSMYSYWLTSSPSWLSRLCCDSLSFSSRWFFSYRSLMLLVKAITLKFYLSMRVSSSKSFADAYNSF